MDRAMNGPTDRQTLIKCVDASKSVKKSGTDQADLTPKRSKPVINGLNNLKEQIDSCILHYKLVLFRMEPKEKMSKTCEKTDFKVHQTIDMNS